MNIISQPATVEEIIKKSRFIGIISACQSEDQTLRLLQEQHHRHPAASHITFAYRINTEKGLVCRFHDAGEPSGTAGKPIFQHLEGKQLINTLIIVIRYFGGIKLGAGGLTRAYGNTAKKCIEAAIIAPYVKLSELVLIIDYDKLQQLEYQLKKLDGQITYQDFAEKIRVTVRLPEENILTLKKALK